MNPIDTYFSPEDEFRYDVAALQEAEMYVILFAHKYTISGCEREDIAQELRLQLWRKIHLYNPKKASVKTWASMVMRNRIIDMIQRTNRVNQDVLDHPDTFPYIEDEESESFYDY